MNFEETKTVKSYFSCSVSVSGWFWRRSRFFLPLAQAMGNVNIKECMGNFKLSLKCTEIQ